MRMENIVVWRINSKVKYVFFVRISVEKTKSIISVNSFKCYKNAHA